MTTMPSEIVFKPEDHSYWIGERRLISVTQALSILRRWEAEPYYLERGRLVHLACEYYDRNELDESTVDPLIRPYLDGYMKFLTETDFLPVHIEKTLYHPQHFYAGRLDRIGNLNDNYVLLDLKTGVKAKVDELQGAAYWELCRVNDIPIKKVFDLYLRDDGGYSLVEIEKPKLLVPTFLAALTLTRWREGI